MENKINVAELLKDCPQGMKLDCTMYDNITLWGINGESATPISIKRKDGIVYQLTKYGQPNNYEDAKCVIFPKGKTTWEGFVPPVEFKDGDILAIGDTVYIYNGIKDNLNHGVYVIVDSSGLFAVNTFTKRYVSRFATEEEKQKLFNAIKSNGYWWNAKAKTLEKLFSYDIGTKVFVKSDKEHKYIHTIVGISHNSCGNLEYEVKEEKTGIVVHYPESLLIPINSVKDDYNLIPDKFDITTFKPFNKVLVRDNNDCVWRADFYSHYEDRQHYRYACVGDYYTQCIPYNKETANLVGTTNDCPDKYKIWKDE